MTMTRKQFLRTIAGAGIGAVGGMTIAACGDDGGTPVDAPMNNNANCMMNGTTVAIGSNHGHTMTISAADVTAGVEKTYTMTGSHPHTVVITAALFTMLQANMTVMATSSSDSGHTHSVTVMCA